MNCRKALPPGGNPTVFARVSEATQEFNARVPGLLRRFASRNDGDYIRNAGMV
jgi:hypothetical protein